MRALRVGGFALTTFASILSSSGLTLATTAPTGGTCGATAVYVPLQDCPGFECDAVLTVLYMSSAPDCGGCGIGVMAAISCSGGGGTSVPYSHGGSCESELRNPIPCPGWPNINFGTVILRCKVCE